MFNATTWSRPVSGNAVTDFAIPAARRARSVRFELQLYGTRQPESARSLDRHDRRRRPRHAGETDTASAYVFDTMTFNERWSLNLGLRYDDYDTVQNGFASDAPERLSKRQSDFLELPGRRGFQAGDQREHLPVDGHFVEPVRQHARRRHREHRASTTKTSSPNATAPGAGHKWALFEDRVSLTTAVFRPRRRNARAAVRRRAAAERRRRAGRRLRGSA